MHAPSVIAIGLLFLVGLVAGAPTSESENVKQGMSRAFSEGMEKFGGAVARQGNQGRVPMPGYTRDYSIYSQGLTALGGGKPSPLDQYRRHSYLPLPSRIVPVTHKPIVGRMTASDAAARYVPHPPLQFAEERPLHI